jgi:NADH-quinone oxidoreductase subunit M
MSDYLLSLLVFIPLIAGAIVLLLPDKFSGIFRVITLVATCLQFLLSMVVFFSFDGKAAYNDKITESSFQLIEKADWINVKLGNMGELSITYLLGVDGISVLMVLLSGLVLVIGAISSWNISKSLKGYHALYLLLSSSIMGCFVALDFFLFYLFFEFMLLPMYFLIGIWGGVRRNYASIKFFIYTLVGSLFILVVMIGLYISVLDPASTDEYQIHTFNMIHMMDLSNYIPGSILSLTGGELFGYPIRLVAFLAVFIGFAIKLPAVPVHTWLPDAHVEAPTPISVILAGILLKIGGYGFFRIAYSIFPEGAYQFGYLIGGLGVIAIIYGGLVAMAQKDLKKLIAYSSVSHMGYVMLGIAALTAEAINGAVFQMFSHGILSAALFLIAGVLYDRTHDRLIANYSGLGSKMPYFTFVVVVIFFGSLGLPGLSGFVGEVLVFLGAFGSSSANQIIPRWLTIVATLGLLITAAYYLWTLQRMFFGKYWVREKEWEPHMNDLTKREYLMFAPLVILAILFGILPGTVLDPIADSISGWVEYVSAQGRINLDVLNGK